MVIRLLLVCPICIVGAFLFLRGLGAVSTAEASEQQILQLASHHLSAHGRDAVDEHLAAKMIKLMLHNAGEITVHPLVVLNEVLVLIFHMYTCGTCHALVYARQGR